MSPPIHRLRARRRRIGLAAGLIGFVVAAALWSCGAPKRGPREVILVVSGDTQGWITPCGCTSNQSGGLLRRATYLAELRQTSDVLYADAGGAIDGDSPFHQAKLAAIFRGEVRMQIAAHNVGGPELRLGPEKLRAIARDTAVPLLSSNVTDAAGNAVFDTIRIITLGGKRIALVGVTAPAPAGVLQIRPAREAIVATLGAHKGSYDTLVVLAYLSDADLEDLARNLPEADFIIGGPTGQPVRPKKLGPTVLAAATVKGKFLVQQPLSGEPGKVVEITEKFLDDPGQHENMAGYRRELAARDFSAAETGLAPQTATLTDKIAGVASCKSCHEAEYKRWSNSKHAQAWKTLESTGAHVDPSCQVCHTTAYGLPGGFVSMRASPDRVNVGCENCHGPSAAHVKEPKVKTLYAGTPRDCRSCHDEENSPRFALESYWSHIQHGTRKGPKP